MILLFFTFFRLVLFALMPIICFKFSVSNTRGHSYKLYQQFSNCTSRSKFFSECVVTLWNSLPGDRVNFSSLHKFKSSLKSTDLMFLVHCSQLVLLCSWLFLCLYILMGFRKCSHSAWLPAVLCSYCVLLSMFVNAK